MLIVKNLINEVVGVIQILNKCMVPTMDISLFDYELNSNLIAQNHVYLEIIHGY